MKGGWLKGWGTGGVTRSNHGMEIWMRGGEGKNGEGAAATHTLTKRGWTLPDGW